MFYTQILYFKIVLYILNPAFIWLIAGIVFCKSYLATILWLVLGYFYYKLWMKLRGMFLALDNKCVETFIRRK